MQHFPKRLQAFEVLRLLGTLPGRRGALRAEQCEWAEFMSLARVVKTWGAMQDALEAVRSALMKRWPDSKVHLFGSTANQLSICNNNDIDVCLELPALPSDAVRL